MKAEIYQSENTTLKDFNNLFIELSAKNCNQHCKYCYIDFPLYKKANDFIEIDTIKSAINDTENENINCIYLLGAEPMTHPNFNAILRMCLKRSNVCICTNASFINEKKARFLKKVEEESKNCIFFKISLDHYDELKNDEIRYRGAFRHAVFAIKNLLKYDFSPIITVTNFYNESEKNLINGFKLIFKDTNFNFDGNHIIINPYYEKNKHFNPEKISKKANRVDCEYGRVLTKDGIYTCPFLAGDYRGRCGSSFKDFSKRATLETGFCTTCVEAKNEIFGINFSK